MQISELTNFKRSPLTSGKACPSQNSKKIFITKTEIWQNSQDLRQRIHQNLSNDLNDGRMELVERSCRTGKAQEEGERRTGRGRRDILTHKSYQAYRNPSKSIESINPLIDVQIESRITSFKEKIVKDSISSIALQRKLQDWARIKTRLIEDVQVKVDTRARSKVVQRKLQTFEEDEEDFQYVYMSRVGRIRKLKSSLIGVARHPNTYENGKDVSIVKQFDQLQEVQRTPDWIGGMDEAIKVKLSLARKGIRSNFLDISNQVSFPCLSSGLPAGGENLIKLSRKVSCNS
jgi:hypothetical protein